MSRMYAFATSRTLGVRVLAETESRLPSDCLILWVFPHPCSSSAARRAMCVPVSPVHAEVHTRAPPQQVH